MYKTNKIFLLSFRIAFVEYCYSHDRLIYRFEITTIRDLVQRLRRFSGNFTTFGIKRRHKNEELGINSYFGRTAYRFNSFVQKKIEFKRIQC